MPRGPTTGWRRRLALLFDVAGAHLGTLAAILAPSDLVALVREQVLAPQETVTWRAIAVDLTEKAAVAESDADRLGHTPEPLQAGHLTPH
jgi:hypothetical protein